MQQQLEARIERLVCTIRTLRTAIEFREHWKETMPERLIQIADEVLHDEADISMRCSNESIRG